VAILAESVLAEIRRCADRAARAECARDLGNVVLGETPALDERELVRRYLTYWFTAFAFFAARDCGGSQFARSAVDSLEVQSELTSLVDSITSEMFG
jgi:hypothetical protein